MSYDIIKQIKIKDNKVFVTAASNNVRPRTFEEFESESLSKILQEQGQGALDLEFLREYENGNFQQGSNKYTRALTILQHMPEYAAFNWRIKETDENRRTSAFDALLNRALVAKLPTEKFILSKLYNGNKVYLRRAGTRSASWTYQQEKAKVFKYKADVDLLRSYFRQGIDWTTEQI